jgi:5'-nucleotidase
MQNGQKEFCQRYDPNGRSYFWMTGNFVNFDKGEDNDEWAIANNYVVRCSLSV